MYYDEDQSIGSVLELVVHNYESNREEYWTEDAKGRKYLSLVDAVAKAMLTASHDLIQKPMEVDGQPFEWEAVEQLYSMKIFVPQIRERIEIEIASELVGQTKAMAERCFNLANLVLHEQPNATVLRFLQRLGRCYIVGFLPECVILCRGVLENAITDAFDRKSLPLPRDELGGSSMAQKLDAAVRFKLLSPERQADAKTVWTRGNKAVHYDPLATKDVFGTIELTLAVLQDLYNA